MALPNSLPLPLMGGNLEGRWWTTLSNIESGKRATENQALQIGPQVKAVHLETKSVPKCVIWNNNSYLE